jgi:hypothetical protein
MSLIPEMEGYRDMKKLLGSTLMLTILVLSMCITLGTVSVTAFRPEHPPLYDRLLKRGWRINIVNGRPWNEMGVPVPINEYTYVHHGWTSDSWTELTDAQKDEFLTTALFELKIDGAPVTLHRSLWYGPAPQGESRVMWLFFWVEFRPYTFEAGYHTFTGDWYLEQDGEPVTDHHDWDILFVEPS